jgi:hypothetical protein
MATKPPTELLRKYLREELVRAGISDEKVSEILDRVFPEKRETSQRRRAKLVLVEKLPQEVVERYRKELELRAAERKLLRREREFEHSVWFVGGTRVIGFVRQGEEATLWDLRKTERKKAPSTRRFIAQKLPPVRVRTVDVRRIIVAKSNQEEVVLAFPSRSSGVTLTPDLLKERPRTVLIRVHHRHGTEECEVEIDDWRDLVRSIPPFCRRCIRVEVSTDGERWFDAFSILPSRR